MRLKAFFSWRFQLMTGVVIFFGSIAWTIAALVLTSEPPHLIAMSGLALVLTGYTMIQNGVTLKSVQSDETSTT